MIKEIEDQLQHQKSLGPYSGNENFWDARARDHYIKHITYLLDRVKRSEEALQPFANLDISPQKFQADQFKNKKPYSYYPIYGINRTQITLQDVLTAREALSPITSEVE